MAAIKPGDVVVADFPGITRAKRRPAVVLSSDDYHAHRLDVILGAITTNLAVCTTPTDCLLSDWATAGLRRPSAFRTFIVTLPQRDVLAVIGYLSKSDWAAVQSCVRRAIAV